MRYDAGHKERTHQKLLHEASLAIRENGPDKVAVAGLMAKVGLTHGGFYAHFKSKEHLVADTIAYMFDDQIEEFNKRMQGLSLKQCLAQYIDRYLSMQHRELRDMGCPMAALNSELSRMPDSARQAFELGMKKSVEAIAAILQRLDKHDPEALAVSVLSEMIGALSVSRAVMDAKFSEQILNAAKVNIKTRLGL